MHRRLVVAAVLIASPWAVASRALGAAEAATAGDGAATPIAAEAAPTTAGCRVEFLRELGWRIAEHASRDDGVASIHGGAPCRRANLGEALRAGDLVARIPRDGEARDAAIEALLAHAATRCAY